MMGTPGAAPFPCGDGTLHTRCDMVPRKLPQLPVRPRRDEHVMPESLAVGGRRVTRPAPLRQAVHDTLAEMIASGSLKPGQHRVESDLAEQLGVSRQPIREALQRLAVDGWVELRPAYGAYVRIPTAEERAQLLGVRLVLAAYSAREAAQHATRERVARLRELYEAGIKALAADDESAPGTANTAP